MIAKLVVTTAGTIITTSPIASRWCHNKTSETMAATSGVPMKPGWIELMRTFFLDRELHHGLDLRRVGDVGMHESRAAARLLDHLHGLDAMIVGHIRHDHVRAVARHQESDLTTDARTRARDQTDLAL